MTARATSSGEVQGLGTRLLHRLESRSFFETAWERDYLHLQGEFEQSELSLIFPLERFDELLMSGGLMSPHLDIVREGKKMAAPFRASPSPATDTARILKELANGSTIRVAHMENYVPSLAEFCRTLEATLHLPLRANLYMTPPFSQGFSPHFDLDDIFVLQVLGTKTWSLHRTYTNQAELPTADLKFDPQQHRSTAPPLEIEVGAGDVLYLPRGFMHEARTDDVVSVHITFAAIGVKLADLIQELVRRLAVSEVGLRRTIAFDPDTGPRIDEIEALADEISPYVNALTTSELLADAASTVSRTQREHRNPDLQGELLRGLESGFRKL